MNKNRTPSARIADNTDRLQYWLYLRHLPGVGSISVQKLLQALGSVEAIFGASHSQLHALGLDTATCSAICDRQLPDISADLNWLGQDNHHIIPLGDDRYPAQLKDLTDPPILLYVRGDPDYLAQAQLAMVGSRNPTAAGRNTAKQFAAFLSDRGITITSGLASGIDGASHEGALQGIAGTIAVVAHGLDIVYPAQHQQLAQKITENGALVSEMPVGVEPLRGLFPRRNRIISALSLGTLVVEAARKSGSLITAQYALEQNREVFAIPGSIHNPMARGCHQLIRQGARLVETADDILEELSPKLGFLAEKTGDLPGDSDKKAEKKAKHPHQALDPDHQKLLKCLAYEPASIDELVLRSQFSAAEVASMLLILELEGIIVCQDGRYTCIQTATP